MTMDDDEKLVGADRVLALPVELAGHPDGATPQALAAAMGAQFEEIAKEAQARSASAS